MGLDGYILTAFIFGIPANEIVLPIILMCYLGGNSLVNIEDTYSIGQVLIQNGWTILTAINTMIFTCLHFPCTTTLLTIKKETGKWKWTLLGFILPSLCGIIICMFTTLIFLSVTLHFSFGENFLRLALCGAVPSIYLCTLLLFLASIVRNQEGLSIIAIVFWVALCFLITALPFHQLLQLCSTTVYVGLAILGLILYGVCSHTIRARGSLYVSSI